MKYNIIIEENVSQVFEVEAQSMKDAISKGIKGYKEGKLVLEPGNLNEARIAVENPSSDELSRCERVY